MAVQTQLSMASTDLIVVAPITDLKAEAQRHRHANDALHASVSKTVRAALLSIDKVPEWYGENPFILSGYRPVSAAVAPCFASWRYWHNQTGNIFSHLVPGLLALALNAALGRGFATRYPAATPADRAVFHVYLTAAALCFGVSATYHTMLCHSRDLADLWIRLDYVSIAVLIVGSFVPQLYVTFYCEPHLLRLYLTIFCAMAAFNIYSSITDRGGSKNWIRTRIVPFVCMSAGAVVPIIHAALLFPYEQLRKQSGLHYYFLEGVFMLLGVIFLATKYPECKYPGRFDYFGSSHTIMHCFVVLGAMSHLAGIFTAFDWNYNNYRCPAHAL
jgi:adiponectin receptor